jgi:hypothetical protein
MKFENGHSYGLFEGNEASGPWWYLYHTKKLNNLNQFIIPYITSGMLIQYGGLGSHPSSGFSTPKNWFLI